MRAFLILLCTILLCACTGPYQEIGLVSLVQAQCHSITVGITLNSNWEPAPNPNKVTYKVFRVLGPSSPSMIESSNDATIEITNLEEFTPYDLFADARSRRKNGFFIPKYRKVGELQVVTPQC